MKNWWLSYKAYVQSVTQANVESELKDINYWRDRLFQNFILYSLPVCMLALIPAIPVGLIKGHHYLIILDVIMALLIVYVSLNDAKNHYFNLYNKSYDILVSTVSKSNIRSIAAHKHAGWNFIDAFPDYYIIDYLL